MATIKNFIAGFTDLSHLYRWKRIVVRHRLSGFVDGWEQMAGL